MASTTTTAGADTSLAGRAALPPRPPPPHTHLTAASTRPEGTSPDDGLPDLSTSNSSAEDDENVVENDDDEPLTMSAVRRLLEEQEKRLTEYHANTPAKQKEKDRIALSKMNAATRLARRNILQEQGYEQGTAELMIQIADGRSLLEESAADTLAETTAANAKAASQASAAIHDSRSTHGVEKVRSDQLGEFDSDPVKFIAWSQRVTALHDSYPSSEWQHSIVIALPLVLKESAADWHSVLSDATRAKLTTWPAWKEAMSGIFMPDKTYLRHEANNRTWIVRKELITTYFYAKLSLLKHAYPTHPEDAHVADIKLGLPPDLQRDVRTVKLRSLTATSTAW